MVLILLAIVFSTALFVCFKYFERLNVNTFHAILINYFVASITSYAFADKSFSIDTSAYWFRFSAALGLLFILTFVATSIAAQKVSLIISIIASKMSLVIPLTYAVVFIGEEMTVLKMTAIILAMAGVVLTVIQPGKNPGNTRNLKSLILIAAVFTGSGMVDTSFKYIESNFYSNVPPQFIMMLCYAGAALFGTIYLLVTQRKIRISLRSFIGGVILGILNYFSFVFVLDALHDPKLPSTVVFPLVNVGVLLLSTLVAILLFHERLRTINYIGVAISIISIILLALQNYVIQP